MKQAVIRQVKTLSMSCDPVGNLLLVKFSFIGAKDACVFVPGSTALWLLEHIPPNQDPTLMAPPQPPSISQADWDDMATPRVLSIQCKQFEEALRMSLELDQKAKLTLVLDRSNVELMRQALEVYRGDLINLDAA